MSRVTTLCVTTHKSSFVTPISLTKRCCRWVCGFHCLSSSIGARRWWDQLSFKIVVVILHPHKGSSIKTYKLTSMVYKVGACLWRYERHDFYVLHLKKCVHVPLFDEGLRKEKGNEMRKVWLCDIWVCEVQNLGSLSVSGKLENGKRVKCWWYVCECPCHVYVVYQYLHPTMLGYLLSFNKIYCVDNMI